MSRSGFHPFDGKSNADDAYLSYHDIRLVQEDINTLKDDWLTDNVIAFWEEYLERESLPLYPTSSVVLLRPAMAMLLLHTPDPLTLKEALPSFTKTSHIFLPINNCSDVSRPEGGSHWSLLLVSVRDGVAFHYDSLYSANIDPARIVCDKISTLLGRHIHLQDLEDSPQQENSSDCGVFVCVIMKHLLLRRLLTTPTGREINMSMGQSDVNAKKGRVEILRIIYGLRKEAKMRSRSRSPLPPTSGSDVASRSASGVRSGRSPPRID